MTLTLAGFLPVLATLLVTVDPLGLAPIFLSLTGGMDRATRHRVALEASVAAFVVLALFALGGTAILEVFGVTLPAFRTAGGLLLFAIAFEMIFERRHERQERSAERVRQATREVAIFPLAVPLLAGPGAISAVILLASSGPTPSGIGLLLLAIALTAASAFLVFLVADRVDALIGPTVRAVITRVLGMILAALAVQFVADGVRALAAAPPPA